MRARSLLLGSHSRLSTTKVRSIRRVGGLVRVNSTTDREGEAVVSGTSGVAAHPLWSGASSAGFSQPGHSGAVFPRLFNESELGGVTGGVPVTGFRQLLTRPPQEFFFQRSMTCRLCGELCLSPRDHMSTGTHCGYEVVLDSLMPLALEGRDVEATICSEWTPALRRHFPRVDPQHFASTLGGLQTPPSSHCAQGGAKSPLLERLIPPARLSQLRSLLRGLKRLGFLHVSLMEPQMFTLTTSLAAATRAGVAASLSPASANAAASASSFSSSSNGLTGRTMAFERMECIGDNTWGSNVSARLLCLFPHMQRQWVGGSLCAGLNALRDCIEANANLERVYDLLDIDAVLAVPLRSVGGNGKFRADIIEALFGELHLMLWSFEPCGSGGTATNRFVDINGLTEGHAHLSTVVEHVLSELFDVVALAPLGVYAERALPLLREACLEGRFMPMRPGLVAPVVPRGNAPLSNLTSSAEPPQPRRRAPMMNFVRFPASKRLIRAVPLPSRSVLPQTATAELPFLPNATFGRRHVSSDSISGAASVAFARFCADPVEVDQVGEVLPPLSLNPLFREEATKMPDESPWDSLQKASDALRIAPPGEALLSLAPV